MLIETIHEKLKALRIDAGLTQTELAERLGSGYSKQVVSAIENGNRPVGIRILTRWAEVCGYTATIDFIPNEKKVKKFIKNT